MGELGNLLIVSALMYGALWAMQVLVPGPLRLTMRVLRRLGGRLWNVAYRILWAWVLTIPASAAVGFATYMILSPFLGQ